MTSQRNAFHDLLLEKRWDPWIVFIDHDDKRNDDKIEIRNLRRQFCEIVFWAKELKDLLPYTLYVLAGMTHSSITDEEAVLLLKILKVLIMAYGLEKKPKFRKEE